MEFLGGRDAHNWSPFDARSHCPHTSPLICSMFPLSRSGLPPSVPDSCTWPFGFQSLCLPRPVTLSSPSLLAVLSICPYNARFRNTQKCPEYVQVSALSFHSTRFLAGTRLIHSAIGAFGWVRVGRFSRLRFAGTGKTGSPNWSGVRPGGDEALW